MAHPAVVSGFFDAHTWEMFLGKQHALNTLNAHITYGKTVVKMNGLTTISL